MNGNVLQFNQSQKPRTTHRLPSKEDILVELCESLKTLSREDLIALLIQSATMMDSAQLRELLPMIQTNRKGQSR